MKKLNLNVANLGATEILSRQELKKVLGGTGTGTGTGTGEDVCAGKSTTLKCTKKDPNGGDDILVSTSTSIGCPSSNTCPSGQFLTCSCVA